MSFCAVGNVFSAIALEPCVLAPAFPMDHSSNVERGGGSAPWVTVCHPYLLTPALRSGEVTPASLCSVDEHLERYSIVLRD